MGRITLFEENKLKNFTYIGPRYYDHPDGEDLFGKLQYTTLWSGLAGLLLGTSAVFQVAGAPSSLKGKLLLTGQFVLPFVGSALVFTISTYYSTVIRKKDDEMNYVIGGFLAGASLAATTPFPSFGLMGSFLLAGAGYVKKHVALDGRNVFPTFVNKNFPSYLARRQVSKFIEERKGNWTKDPVEK